MRRTTPVRTLPDHGTDTLNVLDLSGDCDLPCPWCSATTIESDARCPSCDRRFG